MSPGWLSVFCWFLNGAHSVIRCCVTSGVYAAENSNRSLPCKRWRDIRDDWWWVVCAIKTKWSRRSQKKRLWACDRRAHKLVKKNSWLLFQSRPTSNARVRLVCFMRSGGSPPRRGNGAWDEFLMRARVWLVGVRVWWVGLPIWCDCLTHNSRVWIGLLLLCAMPYGVSSTSN